MNVDKPRRTQHPYVLYDSIYDQPRTLLNILNNNNNINTAINLADIINLKLEKK